MQNSETLQSMIFLEEAGLLLICSSVVSLKIFQLNELKHKQLPPKIKIAILLDNTL